MQAGVVPRSRVATPDERNGPESSTTMGDQELAFMG
jgi:hypothetical protein